MSQGYYKNIVKFNSDAIFVYHQIRKNKHPIPSDYSIYINNLMNVIVENPDSYQYTMLYTLFDKYILHDDKLHFCQVSFQL